MQITHLNLKVGLKLEKKKQKTKAAGIVNNRVF